MKEGVGALPISVLKTWPGMGGESRRGRRSCRGDTVRNRRRTGQRSRPCPLNCGAWDGEGRVSKLALWGRDSKGDSFHFFSPGVDGLAALWQVGRAAYLTLRALADTTHAPTCSKKKIIDFLV